jgi:hypothetical protein
MRALFFMPFFFALNLLAADSFKGPSSIADLPPGFVNSSVTGTKFNGKVRVADNSNFAVGSKVQATFADGNFAPHECSRNSQIEVITSEEMAALETAREQAVTNDECPCGDANDDEEKKATKVAPGAGRLKLCEGPVFNGAINVTGGNTVFSNVHLKGGVFNGAINVGFSNTDKYCEQNRSNEIQKIIKEIERYEGMDLSQRSEYAKTFVLEKIEKLKADLERLAPWNERED